MNLKNQKHTNRFFTGKTSFEKCDESMNLEKIRQFLFQLQMNEEEFFTAALNKAPKRVSVVQLIETFSREKLRELTLEFYAVILKCLS